MTHQVKVSTAKPDDLSSVLGTQIVEGDNRLHKLIFFDFHLHAVALVSPHIYIHTQRE